jgi:hypothetical protein
MQVCVKNIFSIIIILCSCIASFGEDLYTWKDEYTGNEALTLGLWNFNQDQIVSGSFVTAQDVSNNNNFVTIRGATASFSEGGKFGWALKIGRTTTTSTADMNSIFPSGSDPSVSIEMWVSLNSLVHQTQYLLDKQYNDNSGFQIYLYRPEGMLQNVYRMLWLVGNGSSRIQVTADLVWETDRFYHIAVVWDAETDSAKIYRDGILEAAVTSSGSSIVNNTRKIRIGQKLGTPYNSLDGFLDGLRISDAAYEFKLPSVCGDPTTELSGDISGPAGLPDCYINLYDLAKFAQNWLMVDTTGPSNDPAIQTFFAAAPDTGSTYDPENIYPAGRRFLMTLYSVESPDILNLKADNYTAIGPYYGVQGNVLNNAQAAGLPAFYAVGEQVDFDAPGFVMPSDSHIIAMVTAQVNAVAQNPNILGWYALPEEIRWWRSNEVHYLRLVCDTARAVDPYHRPVWTYEANNRDAASLQNTLVFQDYCGKGMYTNYSGYKDSRIYCRWSTEQELIAIQNVRPNAIALALVEMFQDPPSNEVPLIPAWARHDTYLSLVTGAKGVVIYSGFRRAGFTCFDNYYNAYAQIAEELNGPLNLGQVFLFGQKRPEIRTTVTTGPSTVTMQDFGGATVYYNSVSSLSAAHGTNSIGSDRYLFLVNSANSPVTVRVSGLPTAKILRQDIFNSTDLIETTGGSFSLDLAALEVKCFKFTPAANCGTMAGDFAGPGGLPDCTVDFYDISVLVDQWLTCSNPTDSNCY